MQKKNQFNFEKSFTDEMVFSRYEAMCVAPTSAIRDLFIETWRDVQCGQRVWGSDLVFNRKLSILWILWSRNYLFRSWKITNFRGDLCIVKHKHTGVSHSCTAYLVPQLDAFILVDYLKVQSLRFANQWFRHKNLTKSFSDTLIQYKLFAVKILNTFRGELTDIVAKRNR